MRSGRCSDRAAEGGCSAQRIAVSARAARVPGRWVPDLPNGRWRRWLFRAKSSRIARMAAAIISCSGGECAVFPTFDCSSRWSRWLLGFYGVNHPISPRVCTHRPAMVKCNVLHSLMFTACATQIAWSSTPISFGGARNSRISDNLVVPCQARN